MATKKPKPNLGGRPPLPLEVVRGVRVVVRLRAADHERYVQAADALGETIADAARDGMERMARRAATLTTTRGKR